jgi:uncharacterized protein (DUF2235 family)
MVRRDAKAHDIGASRGDAKRTRTFGLIELSAREVEVKRIVICADGTWNQRDQFDGGSGKRRPTNVTKIARAVRPKDAHGIDQVVYYHDGVGTGGPLDKLTGGAFGHGIESNIRDLYRFIVYNHAPDDQLYFFGFSRGAFTVRTLAGFMNFAGLVEKDDDYFVPDLYACYEQRQGPGTPQWEYAHRHIRNKRPCPPIEFIGVWDTVGALGAPGLLGQAFNKDKYAYHDVQLNDHIHHAYHALAIDEHRKPFAPTLWQRPANWKGVLEQAWFAGVHCDVGGGYATDGLANEALHWMVEKAVGLDLEVDEDYLRFFTACFNGRLHDSMTPKYRLMGTYHRPIGTALAHGEVLHPSVSDRFQHDAGYRPRNLADFLAAKPAPPLALTQRALPGVPCPEFPL